MDVVRFSSMSQQKSFGRVTESPVITNLYSHTKSFGRVSSDGCELRKEKLHIGRYCMEVTESPVITNPYSHTKSITCFAGVIYQSKKSKLVFLVGVASSVCNSENISRLVQFKCKYFHVQVLAALT